MPRDFTQSALCSVKKSVDNTQIDVYNFETYCKAMKTIRFKRIASLCIGITLMFIEYIILVLISATINETFMEITATLLFFVNIMCICISQAKWSETSQTIFENTIIKPLIESVSPGAYYTSSSIGEVNVLFWDRVLRTRGNIRSECTVKLPKESVLIRSIETYDKKRRKGSDVRITRFKGVVLSTELKINTKDSFNLHVTSYKQDLMFGKPNGEFVEAEEGDVVIPNNFGLQIMTSDVDIANVVLTEEFINTLLKLQKMFYNFSCVVYNRVLYVAIDTNEFWLCNTMRKYDEETLDMFIKDQKFKLEYSLALCNKLKGTIGSV